MSMDDGYYRKLSELYKDFECWMPFQPAQEDELTRHAGFSGTRVSSPNAGHDATKDARAGSIPTNKKCWSTRKFCNFCRQNGHMSEYYEGHRLRDASGRLECPILRAHVCDVCGATGDEAHTLSYCPVLKAAGVAPPKTALLLKNTLYDSCGRRRRPY